MTDEQTQTHENKQKTPTKNNLKEKENITNTWSIGTHNTRGFNDITKQLTLFKYCHEKQIDIIDISETSLPSFHLVKDVEHNYQRWTFKAKDKYIGVG